MTPLFVTYSATELRSWPVLAEGQADNLHLDDGQTRYWLSRCTVADGEPYNDKVTVERLVEGRWTELGVYRG